MHFLITTNKSKPVGTARPIDEKGMAQIAVRIAGGGYSERQTMSAMFAAQRMRDGDWSQRAAGVEHSIIIAGA